jgi:hypothetical protein
VLIQGHDALTSVGGAIVTSFLQDFSLSRGARNGEQRLRRRLPTFECATAGVLSTACGASLLLHFLGPPGWLTDGVISFCAAMRSARGSRAARRWISADP